MASYLLLVLQHGARTWESSSEKERPGGGLFFGGRSTEEGEGMDRCAATCKEGRALVESVACLLDGRAQMKVKERRRSWYCRVEKSRVLTGHNSYSYSCPSLVPEPLAHSTMKAPLKLRVLGI